MGEEEGKKNNSNLLSIKGQIHQIQSSWHSDPAPQGWYSSTVIGLNRPVLDGQATTESCGDLLLELLKRVQLHGRGR